MHGIVSLPFVGALIAVALLSFVDALMKEAALASGAYTATVLRSVLAAAIIAPVWLARDWHWPSKAVMKLHCERGFLSALMALSWFYAVTKLPLAEAIAISFIAPLIALYFAQVLLGERVQRSAIYASVLGLVGTIVIVSGRFGEEEVSADLLGGLASLIFSAVLYAYNFTVIRRQSQVADPVEIATFHSSVSALVLLVAAPFWWTMPATDTLGLIAIASALTVAGAMAVAWAYARAEAQVLIPSEYSSFIWASLLGWMFFNEVVTVPTLIGTALIVMGCWIAARQQQASRAAG